MSGPRASDSVLDRNTWVDFFTSVPCVKESLITGLVMGSVMAVHMRRTYPKMPSRAANFGFGAFVFGASASFLLCAEAYNKRIAEARSRGPKSTVFMYVRPNRVASSSSSHMPV